MKRIMFVTLLCCAVTSFNRVLVQGTLRALVAPSEYETRMGEDGRRFSALSQHFFDSSNFKSLPAGEVLITGVSFRYKGDIPANTIAQRFSIVMSTFKSSLSGISGAPQANLGSDRLVVFDHRDVRLQGIPHQGQNFTFDVNFVFDNYFPYDARNGNLMFEIRTEGDPVEFAIDYAIASSLGRWTPGALSPPEFGPGYGVIAQFEYIAIPEPTTSAIFLTSFLTIICFYHGFIRRIYRR